MPTEQPACRRIRDLFTSGSSYGQVALLRRHARNAEFSLHFLTIDDQRLLGTTADEAHPDPLIGPIMPLMKPGGDYGQPHQHSEDKLQVAGSQITAGGMDRI